MAGLAPAMMRFGSLAPARDYERLILEPQSPMGAQYIGGGFEIACAGDLGFQPGVLDLADIDCRIPRREQRRRPDRMGNLRRQRMHVVAEQRTVFGVGVEVEFR